MSIPRGWAERDSATLLEWPAKRAALEQRYQLLQDGARRSTSVPRQMASVFDLASDLGAEIVMVESPYIDYDYRSEFSQHFARRFQPPPDRTGRLIFLAGDSEAVGYCVVRPTSKPVGRTVMNVPGTLCSNVTCTAKQDVLAYGRRYQVDGFPFMSQDGEYGRCAHAAIWSIARYQHASHSTGRHSLAAIVEATGTGQLPDRTAMSGGLTVAEVRQALRKLGLPVLTYTPNKSLQSTSFVEVMCRYLDSGFPIAINTPGHLTVLVGYGRDATGKVHWIRCDDNVSPYGLVSDFDEATAEDSELGDWRAALVALPGRIHVPAETAQAAAEITFVKELGATEGPKHLRERWQAGKIEGRTYATKPAELKEKLLAEGPVSEIADFHLSVPTPVWTWVTEFRDVDEDGQVLGTVMIDATSSKHDPNPVSADIDGWCVYYDAAGRAQGRQRATSPVRYPSRLPDRSLAPATP